MRMPREGLDELLASWTGDGDLLDGLAASIEDEFTWSAADVRHRAHRVLLGKVLENLGSWPATAKQWARHLPITVTSERVTVRAPTGSVRWAETARRHGWPPRGFACGRRQRSSDDVAVSALAWVVQALSVALVDVSRDAKLLAASVRPWVVAAAEALAQVPAQPTPTPPDRTVLRSLATSGAPWRSVGEVAELVHRSHVDLRFLAYELILPDPSTHGRLFHLSTFGWLLATLRSLGCTWGWRTPLRPGTKGPQVEVRGAGHTWDLWFEAAGARAYYGATPQMYQEAVEHITGSGGPIGADILLAVPDARALILECKWSSRPEYVARGGFHQVASYALDARYGLANEVWAFVVGPAEIVGATGVSLQARNGNGLILGTTSVEGLGDVAEAFLDGTPEILRSG